MHGRRDNTGRCHPHVTGHSRCQHGRRPRTCRARHTEDDPLLGQPLCGDCYDYGSHLVWQWWSTELWKRFTIRLRRLVAHSLSVAENRLAEVATVQYAKVAEYQLRGLVHFHALIRLDGPKTPDGFAPAPARIDPTVMARLVRQAAATVRLTVSGVDPDDPNRVLAFGQQLDARPVRISRRTDDPDRALTPEQVAGYLAKYATKSRRYSVTLRALRRARRRAQALIADSRATGRPLDLAALDEADLLADDEDETTLVIGQWTYAGSGWSTEAQRVLATAAAARAREYDQWKAQRKASVTNSGERTR